MNSNIVRQMSCKTVDKCLRPSVPDKQEPPIMGLKSNKNFIVANAVENILSGVCFIKFLKTIFLYAN